MRFNTTSRVGLHWYSHSWAPDCSQQWVTVFPYFLYAGCFLYSHPSLPEESQFRRSSQGPVHLCFSCHCCCFILCTLFIPVPKAYDFLPHWQSSDCILYPGDTYVEPFNLYPQKWRGQKGYEEALGSNVQSWWCINLGICVFKKYLELFYGHLFSFLND